MSHLFTAVTEAVFPCLEKVVGVFSGWHWIFKILALAAASIIAFIFSSVQVTLHPERDSLLMPRRVLRFVCCLLPAWYVMRHFPLETPSGAWSVLLAVGFLLSGFLILWFLLTRCVWRVPQFLFNLIAFLLLGVLFGRIKSGFLSAFLLLVLALIAFFFSHIMDTESGKPESHYKRPVKTEPASGSRTEPVAKPDPEPVPAEPAPAKPATAKEPNPKPAAKPTAPEASAKPKPAPVPETAAKPAVTEKPAPAPVPEKAAAARPAPASEKPKAPEASATKPAAAEKAVPSPVPEKPKTPETPVRKPAPAPEKPKAPAPK